MIVGTLGSIVFLVTNRQILTPSQIQWSGSARWAVHQRHLQGALTEYTGVDPDRITFQIYLATSLGIDPMGMIHQIFQYEREGTPITLTIGEHGYGKYRWVVVSHEVTTEHTDKRGNLLSATVSVTLQEYLKE